VTTGDVRHRLTHRSALEADLDGFQMERVEDELDSPTDERGIDLIGVAEQVDGAGLCDHAPLGPQEGLVKLFADGGEEGAPPARKRSIGASPVSVCRRR